MSSDYPPFGSGTTPPPGQDPTAYPPPPGYYPPPPGYYAPPVYVAAAPQNNGLALASMICGIVGICGGVPAIAAVICGHLALGQIKRSNVPQEGHGMAVAGLILGYIGIGLWVLVILFYIIGIIVAISQAPNFPVPTVTPYAP